MGCGSMSFITKSSYITYYINYVCVVIVKVLRILRWWRRKVNTVDGSLRDITKFHLFKYCIPRKNQTKDLSISDSPESSESIDGVGEIGRPQGLTKANGKSL